MPLCFMCSELQGVTVTCVVRPAVERAGLGMHHGDQRSPSKPCSPEKAGGPGDHSHLCVGLVFQPTKRPDAVLSPYVMGESAGHSGVPCHLTENRAPYLQSQGFLYPDLPQSPSPPSPRTPVVQLKKERLREMQIFPERITKHCWAAGSVKASATVSVPCPRTPGTFLLLARHSLTSACVCSDITFAVRVACHPVYHGSPLPCCPSPHSYPSLPCSLSPTTPFFDTLYN